MMMFADAFRPYRLRLLEAAQRRGFNLRQLSEQLDIPYQTFMYWNQGRALPKLPQLLHLLHRLDCQLDELVELSRQARPQGL
jgi:transcriptional regulator with XRE-family HTH domain